MISDSPFPTHVAAWVLAVLGRRGPECFTIMR